MQRLQIRIKQEYGDWRKKEGTYSKRRRIAGGALEGPSSERLMPAIATGKPRVLGVERRRKEEVLQLMETCCRCWAKGLYLWAKPKRWIE